MSFGNLLNGNRVKHHRPALGLQNENQVVLDIFQIDSSILALGALMCGTWTLKLTW